MGADEVRPFFPVPLPFIPTSLSLDSLYAYPGPVRRSSVPEVGGRKSKLKYYRRGAGGYLILRFSRANLNGLHLPRAMSSSTQQAFPKNAGFFLKVYVT